jgi:hypothetical protein
MGASAGETDSTRAVRDTGRGSKNRTIPAAIKKLWRTVAAVTRRNPDAPKPATKRKRGDTSRTFAAAKAILRPTPADILPSADAFNGIDWINLWQANAAAQGNVSHEWNMPPQGPQL